MSKREELMCEINSFILENKLAEVYSGCGLSEDKKYRYVLFSKPRTLDGTVRIYGPKWFLVEYQTAYRSLPRNDKKVFTSVEDVLKFLKLAFVDHNFDEALKI